MKRDAWPFLIVLAVLVITALSCEKKEIPVQQQKIVVVTTLFPLYDFAKALAADRADVTLLLPPGVEAHAYEPKPGDILKLSTARLFIYTGQYMEPWAQQLIKGAENKELVVVDASRGIKLMEARDRDHEHGNGEGAPEREHRHHGAYDPHIWLDLENAGKMVDNITGGLSAVDPANKEFYLKRAG